jgi:nicotinate phosphoribosyltransferase
MSGWVDDSNAALLTDLYELTMLQSYFDHGMSGEAVFDLFVRRLPPERNYLIACGLEHVLHYLESLSFSTAAVEYLRSLDRFTDPFLDSLRDFRFTGSVYAVTEGSVVFANEPIVEIIAPIPEAQLVETFVMNQIQLPTLAASKSSRVVHAAAGRSVIDYGLRRIHGADAGLKAARAFYIAGVDATSNVLAGQTFGIPVSGTMAHSYVQACDSELQAFRQFARSFPTGTLLIDTYDTLEGARNVIRLAAEMGNEFRVQSVRLDSGDLEILARQVRQLLNDAGLSHIKIFASATLDEYAIQSMLSAGAPIDGFGVGVKMGTSEDVPFLDTVYKLAEYEGRPRMKLSTDKSTLPGRKQVYRQMANGLAVRDVIGLWEEKHDGVPLLVKVMEGGRRLAKPDSIQECRARRQAALNNLPKTLLELSPADPGYPVSVSAGLTQLQREARDHILHEKQ